MFPIDTKDGIGQRAQTQGVRIWLCLLYLMYVQIDVIATSF